MTSKIQKLKLNAMNQILQGGNTTKILRKLRTDLDSVAASRVSAATRGMLTRAALKPRGNFTFVNKAAATPYFQGFRTPRRVKPSGQNMERPPFGGRFALIPNQVYYNDKGIEHFKFERGYPDIIHRNMVTLAFPNPDKRIVISDGETSNKKEKRRMFNINTLEKWIISSKKAQTPLRNPIKKVDKNRILQMATKKDELVQILYGNGYTVSRGPFGHVVVHPPNPNPSPPSRSRSSSISMRSRSSRNSPL